MIGTRLLRPVGALILWASSLAIGATPETLLAAASDAARGATPDAARSDPSFKPRSISTFDRRKAEVLLRDKLPCLGCHELNGRGGRIGPPLTDVRARRSSGYILAMIANPQTIVPGTLMPRVVMTDATRELIANYLLQPDGALTQIPTTPVQARQATPLTGDGPALYTRFCVPCHGASGGGDGPNAPFLAVRPAVHDSQESMSARSDDALFDTIFSGGAVMNRSPRMPGYGATLTRGQIWTLVRHIRTLCRCEGPAWSRDSAR